MHLEDRPEGGKHCTEKEEGEAVKEEALGSDLDVLGSTCVLCVRVMGMAIEANYIPSV